MGEEPMLQAITSLRDNKHNRVNKLKRSRDTSFSGNPASTKVKEKGMSQTDYDVKEAEMTHFQE